MAHVKENVIGNKLHTEAMYQEPEETYEEFLTRKKGKGMIKICPRCVKLYI